MRPESCVTNKRTNWKERGRLAGIARREAQKIIEKLEADYLEKENETLHARIEQPEAALEAAKEKKA